MRNKLIITLIFNLLLTINSVGQYGAKADRITNEFIYSQEISQIGKQAPDWKLKDSFGKIHCLSDYKGKLLLIEFLSTRCGPCVQSINDVNEINSKYHTRNFAVIGILKDEIGFNIEDILKGIKQLNGINYLTLLNGISVFNNYKVTGTPTFFLINQEGIIIKTKIGRYIGDSKKELTDLIEKNL